MKTFNLVTEAKRNKLKMFQTTPYPAHIIVYRISDMAALLKVLPDHSRDMSTNNGACCWVEKEGYRIITIGIRDDLTDFMAVVCHECYHAMNCVYSWFGATHELHNDEPGAYLLGHLVRETARCFAELTAAD